MRCNCGIPQRAHRLIIIFIFPSPALWHRLFQNILGCNRHFIILLFDVLFTECHFTWFHFVHSVLMISHQDPKFDFCQLFLMAGELRKSISHNFFTDHETVFCNIPLMLYHLLTRHRNYFDVFPLLQEAHFALSLSWFIKTLILILELFTSVYVATLKLCNFPNHNFTSA